MQVLVRMAAGVALAAGGAWISLNLATYRAAEAWSLQQIVDGPVAGQTYRAIGSATVFVGLGSEHAVGLRIDQLCSTGAIAGLMCLLTGGLLAFTGAQPGRGVLALAVMVATVAGVNGLRLTLLSWSVARYGLSGWFEWLHLYGGAAVSMAAVAAGCAFYLRLIRRPVPRLGRAWMSSSTR